MKRLIKEKRVNWVLTYTQVGKYRPHEADDGTTALDFLNNNHVDTDLNMTHMDGDVLCLKIRADKNLKDLPIIFLSANDDRDTIISLFRLGATDYLKKPFLQEELMARLKVHLQREKLMSTLRDVTDIRSSGQEITSASASGSNLTVQEN